MIDLDISNKDLHKVFYGNPYYRIKGIKSKKDDFKFNLSKPNNFLLLESNFKINGFNNLILSPDSLTFFINEAKDFPIFRNHIKFNNYLRKDFFLMPTFSLENFELIGLRNTNIYQTNENYELKSYFHSLEKNKETLEDLVFYEESINDIIELESKGVYPSSKKNFYFIQNPFTNKYSIIPDFRFFTKHKNSISSNLIDQLKIESKNKFENKRLTNFLITKDTIIDKDLVIKNKKFRILNNSDLILKNGAKLIIDESTIDIIGKKNDSIKIIGYDINSILIRNCKEVNFSFCKINGLSNFTSTDINLPSALTFYNSKVFIRNTLLESNVLGDDYINFFYSDFNIQNTNFRDVNSDAVDSDFSTGSITNSNFVNIGNDAIDFSGSNASLSYLNFNNVNDKAVSVGENSDINLKNLKIFDSEIGIVVKDGSIVESKNILFNNNKVNYCSFMKKGFYDYPTLKINDSVLIGINLIEINTKLETTNEKLSVKQIKNVESLLYGNIYGKSSK